LLVGIGGIVGVMLWTTFALAQSSPEIEQLQEKIRVMEAQAILRDLGFDPGPVDGKLGPKTKEALRRFQAAQGLPITGDLDGTTQKALEAQKPKIAQKKWEELKQTNPEEYRQSIVLAQIILGRFGYGTGPFDGELNEKTQNESLSTWQELVL
ncbi:MAG: peptidoglycan-binding protein, partial [Candidatus Tectomicrobia bacterium]|nr:peptidoglycan-binding protein [Candidatus Tectomicrobia bacterium]